MTTATRCMILAASISVVESMSFLPPPIWAKDFRSDTPLFRFVDNGLAGWIDVRGNIVIPAKFQYTSNHALDDFFEGVMTSVSPKHDGNLFDTAGNPLSFSANFAISRFSEGLIAVNGRYLDRQGRVAIAQRFEGLQSFSEGLAAVQINGKWGYIDHFGVFAIAPYLHSAGPFVDGIATVATQGPCNRNKFPACQFIAIDKRGVAITKRSYDLVNPFSQGLAAVFDKSAVGYIDKSGNLRIPLRLRGGGPFREGLAPFTDEGRRWGYMNLDGEPVIAQQYHRAYSFVDGAALVGDVNGKWWFIDRRGNKLFGGREFMAATGFHLGLAHVAYGEYFAYINREGVEVFRYRRPPRN